MNSDLRSLDLTASFPEKVFDFLGQREQARQVSFGLVDVDLHDVIVAKSRTKSIDRKRPRIARINADLRGVFSYELPL
jgi:hypothetical protein